MNIRTVSVSQSEWVNSILLTVKTHLRYRLGDVVKVVGFHNQCPIIEFQYRYANLTFTHRHAQKQKQKHNPFPLALSAVVSKPCHENKVIVFVHFIYLLKGQCTLNLHFCKCASGSQQANLAIVIVRVRVIGWLILIFTR